MPKVKAYNKTITRQWNGILKRLTKAMLMLYVI